IPEPSGPIIANGCEPAVVAAKRERANRLRVPSKDNRCLRGVVFRQVPEKHLAISTSGGDPLAVGTNLRGAAVFCVLDTLVLNGKALEPYLAVDGSGGQP